MNLGVGGQLRAGFFDSHSSCWCGERLPSRLKVLRSLDAHDGREVEVAAASVWCWRRRGGGPVSHVHPLVATEVGEEFRERSFFGALS